MTCRASESYPTHGQFENWDAVERSSKGLRAMSGVSIAFMEQRHLGSCSSHLISERCAKMIAGSDLVHARSCLRMSSSYLNALTYLYREPLASMSHG